MNFKDKQRERRAKHNQEQLDQAKSILTEKVDQIAAAVREARPEARFSISSMRNLPSLTIELKLAEGWRGTARASLDFEMRRKGGKWRGWAEPFSGIVSVFIESGYSKAKADGGSHWGQKPANVDVEKVTERLLHAFDEHLASCKHEIARQQARTEAAQQAERHAAKLDRWRVEFGTVPGKMTIRGMTETEIEAVAALLAELRPSRTRAAEAAMPSGLRLSLSRRQPEAEKLTETDRLERGTNADLNTFRE